MEPNRPPAPRPRPTQPASTPRPHTPQSAKPKRKRPTALLQSSKGKTLGIGGWIGTWIQLIVLVLASVSLFFVFVSRNLDEEANNIYLNIAAVLTLLGVLALAAGAWTAFRYTRLSRALRMPSSTVNATNVKITLRTGIWIGLTGTVAMLVAAAISTAGLLAKLLVQPQGAAIYNPDEVLRVIDALIILADIGLATAHFAAAAIALWIFQSDDVEATSPFPKPQ